MHRHTEVLRQPLFQASLQRVIRRRRAIAAFADNAFAVVHTLCAVGAPDRRVSINGLEQASSLRPDIAYRQSVVAAQFALELHGNLLGERRPEVLRCNSPSNQIWIRGW